MNRMKAESSRCWESRFHAQSIFARNVPVDILLPGGRGEYTFGQLACNVDDCAPRSVPRHHRPRGHFYSAPQNTRSASTDPG